MIRLPGQLQSKLDRSLAKRKTELASQRATVLRAAAEAPVLRRSGITLIYAHWEGFFREACEGYLELVGSTARRVHELTPTFQAMAMRGQIRRFGASGKTADHVQLIDLIRRETRPPSSERRLPWRRAFRLGNMKPESMREAIECLGLDYDPFALQEHQLIRRIRRTRNLIAHGRGVPVDQTTYDELHRGTIDLLDVLRDQVLDASSTAAYLANQP